MKFFKRMKKKLKEQVPYVEPVKPKPKVIKTFKDLRIVLSSRPIIRTIVQAGETPEVEKYENHLIIEKRDTNAMEEPFFKMFKEDPRWIHETYNSSYGFTKPYDYESEKLLFELIEEMFLND
jgi:hypothetical protein